MLTHNQVEFLLKQPQKPNIVYVGYESDPSKLAATLAKLSNGSFKESYMIFGAIMENNQSKVEGLNTKFNAKKLLNMISVYLFNMSKVEITVTHIDKKVICIYRITEHGEIDMTLPENFYF